MAKNKCADCGAKSELTGKTVKHERLPVKIIMVCEKCINKKPKKG